MRRTGMAMRGFATIDGGGLTPVYVDRVTSPV